MKILFDHQIFSLQNYGGISRYFYEIAKGINDDPNLDPVTYSFFSNNHYINTAENNIFKSRPFFSGLNFKGKQRLIKFINSISCTLKLKNINFDIIHPTYYDPWFLKYTKNKPLVLTIYDMTHEMLPEFFSKSDLTGQNKKRLAQKADKIIAISENTKKDIINLYNINPDKISVTHLACSFNPCSADLAINDSDTPIDLPKKYLLFIGSREGYKNFEKLAKAIAVLFNDKKDLMLVCAGGGKLLHKEKEHLKSLNIHNRVIQRDLTDTTLQIYYKKALAFIFPSLYEGFGIPVLEAFSCDCPLLCSDCSSLPEIAGNAALYFDPNNVNSIKDALYEIVNSEIMRKNLIDKGRVRLKDFTWQKTVEQTKTIYKTLS